MLAFYTLQVWGAGADPSFGIQILKGDASVSCQAIRVETGKSDRCFAITASECLPDPKTKTGNALVRSKEFGEQNAQYLVTAEEIALLHWSCPHRDVSAPYFFLNGGTKVVAKEAVEFGRVGREPAGPRQLTIGHVGQGDDKQREIQTPHYQLTRQDLGSPMLCSVEGDVSDLCGILVSVKHSRYAVGESLDLIRTRMRELGVKEWKVSLVNGRRVPLVEDY